MTTYILLRKNKESAPLTIEDLKTLDLVPDDRIWVEGQSVYWLSPGEITELKPLLNGKFREVLPHDPEKIPAETKTETVNKVVQKSEDSYVPEVEKPIIQHEVIKKAEPVPEKSNGSASVNEYWKNYLPKESKTEKPVVEEVVVREQTNENYFNPAPHRNYPIKRKSGPPDITRIAVYTGILILGVVAGLLIKNSGGKKNKLTSQTIPSSTASETKKVDSTLLNVTPVDSTVDPVITTDPGTTNTGLKNEEPATEKNLPATSPAKEKNNAGTDSLAAAPVTESKNDRKETVENEKKGPSEDISSQVSVKTNDYIVGSFGGIRNLELTVTNNSKYTLDKVTVDLQYLKPRDEFIRSEHIIFSSIPPGGSQKIPVKKSTRGVKVETKILRIDTKESGF